MNQSNDFGNIKMLVQQIFLKEGILMKKISTFILAFTLFFSGCGVKNSPTSTASPPTELSSKSSVLPSQEPAKKNSVFVEDEALASNYEVKTAEHTHLNEDSIVTSVNNTLSKLGIQNIVTKKIDQSMAYTYEFQNGEELKYTRSNKTNEINMIWFGRRSGDNPQWQDEFRMQLFAVIKASNPNLTDDEGTKLVDDLMNTLEKYSEEEIEEYPEVASDLTSRIDIYDISYNLMFVSSESEIAGYEWILVIYI